MRVRGVLVNSGLMGSTASTDPDRTRHVEFAVQCTMISYLRPERFAGERIGLCDRCAPHAARYLGCTAAMGMPRA